MHKNAGQEERMICRDCPSILIRNSDGRCFCERSEEEVMPDWKCHIKNDDPLGRQMYYGDDDPLGRQMA